MADEFEDERREAAAAIDAQNRRRICNECSHTWLIPVGAVEWVQGAGSAVQCPECGTDDTISEADLLADQAEKGLPA